MKGATLVVNGEKFSIDEVDKVPNEIKVEKAKTIRIDNGKGILFRDHHSSFSYMSESEFEFEGKKYFSDETAYQSKKDNGYHDTAMKIRMHAKKDPYRAKRMAKFIKEKPDWAGKKEKVMKAILEAKFSQNSDLREAKLCEGTSDRYWGCGTPITQSKTIQVESLQGKNMLGNWLMEVRKDLVKR